MSVSLSALFSCTCSFRNVIKGFHGPVIVFLQQNFTCVNRLSLNPLTWLWKSYFLFTWHSRNWGFKQTIKVHVKALNATFEWDNIEKHIHFSKNVEVCAWLPFKWMHCLENQWNHLIFIMVMVWKVGLVPVEWIRILIDLSKFPELLVCRSSY